MSKFYGWKPGLPSRRFPKLALASYPPLPAAFDLTPTGFLPPIFDQGQTSSCTGHGTTRAIMFARAKQGLPFIDLSRLFPYWNARAAEGSTAADDGASVGDAIAASQKFGDCPYADLPTDSALVTVAPSIQAFADAIKHTALAATRVWGANDNGLAYHTKHCIAILGLPVPLGITVYESFESDKVANTGMVLMPAANEEIVGGHCVVAVAYDDLNERVLCNNSWGPDWGLKGSFWIPYRYIFNSDYADDFHAITLESAS
jgi:C1A family cysteine protease